MIINLKEAEKTALANHLAEKSVEVIAADMKNMFPITDERKEAIRKQEFNFFKKALDETNDY
jgi:hypothetical protein